MVASGSQACIRLGSVLLVLSGIPIYSNLTKKQTLFSFLCFSSYTVISVQYMYTIVGTEFTFNRLFEEYYVLPSFAFSFGTALSFYKLFIRRQHLYETFFKWKDLARMIKRHEQKAKRITMVFVLKLFIFVLFIIGPISDTFVSFFLYEPYISHETFWYLVFCLFLFVYFTNWAVMFNMTAGFILVIEINDWLVESMLRQRDVLNLLDTVLPVVEVDSVFIAHPTQGRTFSSHRCSPWYVKMCRYRTLKRLFCQVQDFRLRMNRLYYIPVALISFTNACYLPITFAGPYGAKADDSKVFTKSVSIFVWLVYGIAALIPYCVRQLVEDRDSYLRVEINKEVYIVSDDQTKNVLLNISGFVKNRYPRSPFCFFDVNLEVLLLVVETSVLMATTFLVQNKA